jgi:hypothetical protein
LPDCETNKSTTEISKDATSQVSCGKNGLRHKDWGTISLPHNVLGAVINNMSKINKKPPQLLDVVALLDEVPEKSLASGQVGTVVEVLDAANLLVEFSDNEGRPFAITPVQQSQLLVLHYVPETA